MLPTNIGSLLIAIIAELIMFGVVFGLAWFASRATLEQLLLRWKGGFGPVARGLLYSLGLRLGLFVVGVVVVIIAGVAGVNDSSFEKLRPEVENLINARELANNPLYMVMNLTLVSFVLAGFREELWRAGMLAGFVALFPRAFSGFGGQMVAVAIAALLFGVGHVSQGWGGMVMAALLGAGLGAIMVYRQSIWDAVMAHGFFNAASFIALAFMAR